VDWRGHTAMKHAIAKMMLENAETFLDRTEAVETAISLGMPLSDIEQYLDWLEMVRPPRRPPQLGIIDSPNGRVAAEDTQRPKAG
jgi:hypothetical protein